MKGKPKYNYGDTVTFSFIDYDYDERGHRIDGTNHKTTLTGTVYIIDAYGTWDDPSDVSYDIMVPMEKYVTKDNPNGDCLFKHIKETLIEDNGRE